jgi:hypothetical protein
MCMFQRETPSTLHNTCHFSKTNIILVAVTVFFVAMDVKQNVTTPTEEKYG